MNRKIQAWLCATAVFLAGFVSAEGHPILAIAALSLFCAALGLGYKAGFCYINTLSNLNYTLLGQKVLEAFTAYMTATSVFATNYSEAETQRGNKVKVAFVSGATASQDWVAANGYVAQDSEIDGLDITINKRKYVEWNLTTQEMADNPQVNMDRFARQKGFALAKDVLQDIWSVITNANYGAPVFTGAAANLDSDAIADIETVCDEAFWPDMERGLILKPAYASNLTKDSKIVGTVGLEQSEVLQRSRIGTIHNFNTHKSPFVPDNGENLRFFATHPDAILIASRVLVPEDPSKIIRFERLADPMGTGLTLAFREWTDPVLDKVRRIFEFNYGYLKGNPNGIKRGVSA
jgi:hypothetical protein